VFPSSVASGINDILGLKPINSGSSGSQLYGKVCSDGKIPRNLPNIILELQDVTLTISPSTYIFMQPDNFGRMICISGFAGQDGDSAIIGNIILRQFYTVFDQASKKIGFANCNRDHNGTSNFVKGSFANSPNGTADPKSVTPGVFQTQASGQMKLLQYTPIILFLATIII
jgi:hypothetical protein